MKNIMIKKTLAVAAAASMIGVAGSTVAFALEAPTAKPKKITICHNGSTITISRNALSGHFEVDVDGEPIANRPMPGHKNDKVGSCDPENSPTPEPTETESFTPKNYTLVFRMPDTATKDSGTWFPQTLLNRNGVIPDDGCAKFQFDEIRITTPQQEEALEVILADGILTQAESSPESFQAAGYVRGGQVWQKDKCGATTTPTTPPTTPEPTETSQPTDEPSEPTATATTSVPTEEPTTPQPTATTTATPTEQPSTPVPTATTTAPSTPPVTPKPPVVPPKPKPVITKDLVQEDTYRYTSARELRTIKAFAADKKLVYREDKAQWNDSTWRIIERTFTDGKLTSTKVVKAGGNGARAKGSKIVMTWKLGKGATVNAPWGPKKNIPQVFVR